MSETRDPVDPYTELNVAAANALVQRTLAHVKSGKLTFREAAAYEIGKTRGIELDRLEKVEALTRDAFLKAAGPERITSGTWRSCDDDQELVPDPSPYGPQGRLCVSAVAESPEDVRNGETLEHLIEQEKPCLFFYRHPVRPSEKLRPTDPNEVAAWRHVSPYEVRESVKSGTEYLVGWDHDLEAVRNFTLQRIEGLVVVDNQNEFRPPINELGVVA